MELWVALILLAIAFDFINGFHDSANSIATVVSTRVLTPLQAVIWAAFFNFVAFYIFTGHGVADTVKKMVHADVITIPLLIGGLVGAIIWNLLTWYWGIPSSSSHALLGGLTGDAFAKAGASAINGEKRSLTLIYIPLAPIIGMVATYIIAVAVLNLAKRIPNNKID